MLRRFCYWLMPWRRPACCAFCKATEALETSADGVVACMPCRRGVIYAHTNRAMRRAAGIR